MIPTGIAEAAGDQQGASRQLQGIWQARGDDGRQTGTF